MSTLTLAAFSLGFVGIGCGLGLMIYHYNLPWFFSHHSGVAIHDTLVRTEALILARKKRSHGRHLIGVPPKRKPVDEVRDEFEEVTPNHESRKL